MSVQYILNSDYNTIKNEKLTQALEVSTSLKAPVHYVDDIALSNNAGKLNSTATIEATQLEAPIAVIETINVGNLIPQDGQDATISVLGALNSSTDTQSLLKNVKMNKLESWVHGNGVAGQVLSLDANLDLQWKDDATGDVSQWATYQAVQNVNMNNNQIQNASKVVSTEVDVVDYRLTKGSSTTEPSIPSLIITPPVQYGYVTVGGTGNLEVPTGSVLAYGGGYNGKALKIRDPNNNYYYKVICDLTGIRLFNNDGATNMMYLNRTNRTAELPNIAMSNEASDGVLSNLRALTIKAGAGSENQVLSLDANLNLKWKDDAAADVSTWSTYPATQNVDMGNFELQNASKVVATEVDVNEYTIVQGNSTEEPEFKSLIFNPPENYGYISFGNSNNTSNVEIVGDGTFIAHNGGFEGADFRVFNNDLSLTTGSFQKSGLLIKDPATSSNTVFHLNAENEVARLPNIHRDPNSNVLYVVPNTNLSGIQNGTIEAPFNKIQSAVNWVNVNNDGSSSYTISVAPGSYSDTIYILYPKLSIVGNTNSFYGATQTIVDASVNINVGNTYTGNLHGHQLSFENLYFNETVNNNCVGDVCVNFKSCYFYVNEVAYTDVSIVSTQSRLRFIDCYLLSTNSLSINPLVNVSQGMLACSQTQFEVVGNQNCLRLSTNAVVDVISMCKFTSSYNPSTKPLVEITSTVSGSYSFANCGFVYANASTNACAGIYSHPASGSNNVIALYNSFYMTGLAQSVGNYCIKSSNTVVLYFSNNALVGYANAIEGSQGVNKFSMSAVL